MSFIIFFFFFQAEDGIRDRDVTGVQTCALPISALFAWGYTTQSAGDRREQLAPVATFSSGPAGMTQAKLALNTHSAGESLAQPVKQRPSTDDVGISQAEARRLVASASHRRATRLEVVGTESGPAIVAVQEARRSGSTQFLVMEKRAGTYRVAARG